MFLAVLLPPASSSSPGSFRVLQWNAKGLRAKSIELLHFVSLQPVYHICIQESNLNSLPLFVSLETLLWDLIAPTPGLAIFLLIICTPAVASSFLSDRAYPSLNFLSSFSLRLTTTLINISLNNSSSLSFLNIYAPLIRSSSTESKIDSFFLSVLPSSKNLFILRNFNCHYSLWDSKGNYDSREKEVFEWVVSSDFLPLNNPETPPFFIAPMAVAPLQTSPLLRPLLLSEDALGLGFNHFPILRISPPFSALLPQQTVLFLQFSESS